MTLLNELFAEEQAGNNADKHVISRPRLHQENNVEFDHKSWTPHIAFFWHTWHADKICEFHQVKAKIFVVGHFWKSSSKMFCTNRRARWINLVWNTIIIRTERTGNSKTCFQTCCDQLLDSSQEQKKVNVIMPCVASFLQALHRKEFEEELLQYQAKVRKWMHAQRRCTMNWETLWLLRVHGHRQKWFSAELVKRTQCKKKVFVHLWVVLQESSARKIKHVETYHSESDDSLKPIAVQDHYTAKHHFWKAQSKRFESRAYRWEQHDYCRKYMRERSRTYETTANCDNIANALRETHNLRFNEDKRNLGTNEK